MGLQNSEVVLPTNCIIQMRKFLLVDFVIEPMPFPGPRRRCEALLFFSTSRVKVFVQRILPPQDVLFHREDSHSEITKDVEYDCSRWVYHIA